MIHATLAVTRTHVARLLTTARTGATGLLTMHHTEGEETGTGGVTTIARSYAANYILPGIVMYTSIYYGCQKGH